MGEQEKRKNTSSARKSANGGKNTSTKRQTANSSAKSGTAKPKNSSESGRKKRTSAPEIQDIPDIDYENAERRAEFWNQIIPFILGAVALFLLICYLIPNAGFFGNGLRNILFGLCGRGAFVLPVLLLIGAIFWHSDGENNAIGWKAVCHTVVFLVSDALIHYMSGGMADDVQEYTLSMWFAEGKNFHGGGFFGAVLGGLFYKAFGKFLAVFLLLAVLIVFCLLLFGLTPRGAWIMLVCKIRESKRKREAVQQQYASHTILQPPTAEYCATPVNRQNTARTAEPVRPRQSRQTKLQQSYAQQTAVLPAKGRIDEELFGGTLEDDIEPAVQGKANTKNRNRRELNIDMDIDELSHTEGEPKTETPKPVPPKTQQPRPAQQETPREEAETSVQPQPQPQPQPPKAELTEIETPYYWAETRENTADLSETPAEIPEEPTAPETVDDTHAPAENNALSGLDAILKEFSGKLSGGKKTEIPVDDMLLDGQPEEQEDIADTEETEDTEENEISADSEESEITEEDGEEDTDEEDPTPVENDALSELDAILKEFGEEQADGGETLLPADSKTADEDAPDEAEEDISPVDGEPDDTVMQGENGEEIEIADTKTVAEYIFPPIELLAEPKVVADENVAVEMREKAARLVQTLEDFHVKTKIVDVCRGPTITRYELLPEPGTRVRSIENLVDDIALNLATTGVRIEAPIPGKSAVGVEVPNTNSETVYLRSLIDTDTFHTAKSSVTAALGQDVAGKNIYLDIDKMPHLLIAGATGMGKSVCLNALIVSLLYKAKPNEVKLILVDPKKVELSMYNGIPHLHMPVVSDAKKAAGALAWAVTEMERRYTLLEEFNVRNIKGYNELAKDDPEKEFLPQFVIVIDELADLMMMAKTDVEDSICRIAQKARAAGMHLIIGTQRPSVDVITGLIKANFPSRIAFRVSSLVDSRTIIDQAGAENLVGRGDMLYNPVGVAKPLRVQGAFVSDGEVEAVVNFIKQNNGKAEYDTDAIDQIERNAANLGGKKKGGDNGFGDDEDPLLDDAIEVAVNAGTIATSHLQKDLQIGYGRAARIIDRMQALGIVSEPNGPHPRDVLITKEQYMEMKLRKGEK